MDSDLEKKALDQMSVNPLYSAGPSGVSSRYSFEIFARFIEGNSILEMGPAEGVMTERLVRLGKRLTVVEGARCFCDDLHRRFPGISVVHALFEEYEPAAQFDNIILGHVLEHVENPAATVRQLSPWLRPGGRVLAAVPNCRSLHRQAAVLMGLIQREDELNDLDRHHGHRRVFNPESFRQCFTQAGLQIDVFGGYWIKPLSNSQIEASWTPAMLDVFMRLGERYPDIAAEIYVVASARPGAPP
jgi:2-polyprenyl-3-methyl-5-hydroxy-6-metoxy-1,4-benzoquinol methylase